MKKLLFILLIAMACENPASSGDVSNDIDVDWILVKTPTFEKEYYDEQLEDIVRILGTGYFFYYTSSVTNVNLNNEADHLGNLAVLIDGMLKFTYNGENFQYDLNDAYNSTLQTYFINFLDDPDITQRIIYNQNSEYFNVFNIGGISVLEVNVASPNEIIDYR